MSEIGKPNCKAEPHLFASEAWAVRRFLLHFEPSGMKEQWGASAVVTTRSQFWRPFLAGRGTVLHPVPCMAM